MSAFVGRIAESDFGSRADSVGHVVWNPLFASDSLMFDPRVASLATKVEQSQIALESTDVRMAKYGLGSVLLFHPIFSCLCLS